MPKYKIQLETHDEPDHLATFPETEINIHNKSGQAFFQLQGKTYNPEHSHKNRRYLRCGFKNEEDEENDPVITYDGNPEKIPDVNNNNVPMTCVLYVDKKTRTATLRPVIVHTLVSEKSEILENLECQFMNEQNLNMTLEDDQRNREQQHEDYVVQFGSKMMQNQMKTKKILQKEQSDKYTSELVTKKMEKLGEAGHFSSNNDNVQSSTIPVRDVSATNVSHVYQFTKIFSDEELLNDLAYHSENCQKDEIQFVSRQYGQIVSYLYTVSFEANTVLKGTHLNNNERNLTYAFITILCRLYKLYRVRNNSSRQSYTTEKLNDVLWKDFKVGTSVKLMIEEKFLAFNRDNNEFILPSNYIDKIQSWVLVLSLLLTNFKMELRPFTDFFNVTSAAFEKVCRVCGVWMIGDVEKNVVLRLPLNGIESRGLKRK